MPLFKSSAQAEQQEKPMSEDKKTPIKTFGPFGSGNGSFIEVAVWENTIVVEGDREVKVHAVSFSRNYREKEQWQKTKTLRTQDIPVLQYALGKAYEFMLDSHRNND